MVTHTTNYNLPKLVDGDYFDIDEYNEGFDIIDENIGGLVVPNTPYPTASSGTFLRNQVTGMLELFEAGKGWHDLANMDNPDYITGGPYLDKPVDSTVIKAESGWSIYYYLLRIRSNFIASIAVSCVRTSDYAVGSNGNIVNCPMVTIKDSRFWPDAGGSNFSALSTVGGGPASSGVIVSSSGKQGQIDLCAVTGTDRIKKGDEYSLGGVYFCEGE